VRRVWWVLAIALLALGGTLVMASRWLLHTEAGLQFALRQLDRVQTVSIEVTGARGTLAGPLSVERIVVDHAAAHIDARGVSVLPKPRALIIGRITLDQLVVRQLAVQLKPRPERPPGEPHFLPAGLTIAAPGFAISDIDVTLQGGRNVTVQQVQGALAITRWRIDLDPLELRDPAGFIAGTLALRATEPLGLRTKLQGEWQLPDDDFSYRFNVETRGKLDRLAANIELDAPARLAFAGTLLDLTDKPRAKGTFRATDFDGSPWLPPGRLPLVSGSITLAAGVDSLGMDGTLTTPALPDQQVRLQGAARWAGKAFEIASLRAWLPRTGLEITTSGTVTLPGEDAPEGALPHLALTGDWSALRWPVAGAEAPVVASPQGVYSIAGSLPYRLETRAQVEGAAIPTTSFDLRGVVDKEQIVLESFEGYALRGSIRGNGRLAWTGAQPWRFDVNARSLAIGELRPGIDGRINAAGSIEGAGLKADAPWTARLASLSGTVSGLPLTGRGEIAHSNGTFELRRVRIANGSSHVDINGRVGAEALDLNWDANLRSLALVQRGMSGTLVSSGRARGTPGKPQLTGTARLGQFAFAGTAVTSADLTLDIDASDRQRSRVTLRAQDITTAVLNLASAEARLDGFMSDHTLGLDVTSPGNPERRITEFRGEVRAAGAIDFARKTWAGDIASAAIDFPDGAAKLIQPAALVLSPELQRAEPICLRTAEDARLCVEGEHRARPFSWRVIYSAQDWPLKRLLNTMLGWREFDGRLQASGWAEQAPGAAWVGGTTLLLDEPSFDVPRNKFRTERIRLGRGRLDLFADTETIRAALDFAVDETTQVDGEALVTRQESDLLSSPLRGRVVGKSEVIKVLPLLVPEIDRAAGRLNGEVVIAGTLGQPEFNGDFSLRDGRLELYRTNLVISNLGADGKFVGDQLTFAATGDTAKGKLTVDGEFSWPEGVMTGAMQVRGDELLVADTPDFRIFATPDLVLRAGPNGYEVEGEIRIPTARISPRELTTSVNTSADERIVGLEDVEDTGPSSVDRIVSRISVILGDAVRVTAYGLKARLEGTVLVTTAPLDVARGTGTINVLDGQYKAFGQDVRITRGSLTYRNSPLNDPILEITAERTIKDADVVVGVNVRGTLDQPFITLTSTPAMTDNETLSYLLTGRSIDTLQSGEAANVNQAAENLAVSGGGLLLGGLGTKLGLDEVSVERNGDDDTSVVLGKALSPKLFVSYGISIAEAINTIKLRYTLNKRWSIKAESGLEQSADVEYKIER
jgi:translocation and assembly module TamB